jgi:predicted ATPase/DNA-binding SARP family transcriptional activator
LLGEIEAIVDGRRIDVGHARQRCVLASLLVDVNRPVSVDQLIDRVWADEPPSRARNALAGYLSRLRAVLGGTGDVQIARGPAGYTMTADALLVDLHLFRHLAESARAIADPFEAATVYGRALGLWHGEPFSAIDTPWIADTRVSLEGERLSVELDRNDVGLETGRHTELVAEMVAALAAHPLDERLAGQVMLAQYRSGRQADALDTFRRMRARLVDELGIDPSPGLREIHQQILESVSAEPVPALPPQPRAEPNKVPSTEDRPRYLPRRTGRFIGREPEVVAVENALNRGPLVTLTGVGGVGKTTLALEVADQNQHKFADGVRWCELAPLNDGSAVGHTVAVALGLQENPSLGPELTVIDYLRSCEMLLVIDNCEHVLDSSAQLVHRITRECPRVAVLATSREPLSTVGERVVPVPPLAEEFAAELFAERAKASRPDFDLEREPVGAVAEICRRLDGVPLAIELAAARMRAMSSLDVARRLDRLRVLSGGTRGAHPRQQSVTATIDWSYRLLGESEQALFDRLSVFAGSFDLEAVHGVCADEGSTDDDTLELLTGLVDKSMVTVRGGTAAARYGILETLRAYGRDRLQENRLAEELSAQHTRYYVDLMERFAVGMRSPDERAWVQRMTPDAGKLYAAFDYENLRAAFERAMDTQDIDSALRLVTSLLDLMNRIGYHSAGWAYRVVDVADPDHPLFPAAVGVAGRAAWVLGDFSYARSLAALAKGRIPGPGTSYLAYPADIPADAALYEGDAAAAVMHFESELVDRDGGDPIRTVFLLDRLTLCHQRLGTHDAGLQAGREAVRIADPTANPTTRSMARCALGRSLVPSDPERALKVLDEAAELAASVENNWLTGMAGMESAAIRARQGDPGPAARRFIVLLDHWERGGPGLIPQQWDTLRDVTRLMVRLGANSEAAALHRAFLDAEKESPLDAAQVQGLNGGAETSLTGPEAVALARSTLQRFC